MQRSVLNLCLGVAALGLGAAVIFSHKEDSKGPTLTPFTAETIEHIRIEHPGSPAIELQKEKGVWHLTAPVKSEADPFDVNGILEVASLEAQATLDPATVSAKELGLDPPAYTVTLNNQTLEMGGVEPIKFRRYVRTAGKIALIADPPSAALDADYSDLVTRKLLPADAVIQSIELPEFTIRRSDDGKSWALSHGDNDVTSDAKQKLVDAWKSARALWNAAAPKELKGERAVVTTQNGPLEFIITQRQPQLILARKDLNVSFTLSEELMKQMLQLEAPKQSDKTEKVEKK